MLPTDTASTEMMGIQHTHKQPFRKLSTSIWWRRENSSMDRDGGVFNSQKLLRMTKACMNGEVSKVRRKAEPCLFRG